jgi:hypothetical protein
VLCSAGNLGARTDENGSLKVTAVTAGSSTSPLTPFGNLRLTTDNTAALRVAAITLNPPLGPLTNLANLRCCTDETGALLVATQTAGSLTTPLTNYGNLRARTDARGSLIVANGAAGSLSSAPTPLLNLRGRTDDQGALVVSGLSAPTSPLLTSLVSYWKLEEASGSRADSYGTNPLTPVNTPTNGVGIIGNACNFVGSSTQYLSHASNSDLQLGDRDWTIQFWASIGAAGNQTFLAKDATTREYHIDLAGGQLRMFWVNGGVPIVSSSPVTGGLWGHVLAWYDATANTLNLQINNGTVASVSDGGFVPPVGADEFRIGYDAAGGNPFTGLIDEVAIWKRLLTPAERASLYNGGAGLTYPFA